MMLLQFFFWLLQLKRFGGLLTTVKKIIIMPGRGGYFVLQRRILYSGMQQHINKNEILTHTTPAQ
jgi:hypothetical protein